MLATRYDLTIFVAGKSTSSVAAIENLKRICETDLGGEYDLNVIDVMKDPGAASQNRILATPTVIKRKPEPRRTVVGDLSDRQKVLIGLDLLDLHG